MEGDETQLDELLGFQSSLILCLTLDLSLKGLFIGYKSK
jgi:hypothetical protein